MKIIQSVYFRAAFAAVIGILILSNPLGMLKITSIAVGLLFLLTGLYSCLTYYGKKMNLTAKIINGVAATDDDATAGAKKGAEQEKAIDKPRATYSERATTFSLPVVGMGSTILGLCLTFAPSGFATLFMYVLGGSLLIVSFNQFFTIYQASKQTTIPSPYWIAPTLLLLAGLFIIINPLTSATAPLIIVAIGLLIYAISEVVNTISIERMTERAAEMRRMERSAREKKESRKNGEYVDYIVTDED